MRSFSSFCCTHIIFHIVCSHSVKVSIIGLIPFAGMLIVASSHSFAISLLGVLLSACSISRSHDNYGRTGANSRDWYSIVCVTGARRHRARELHAGRDHVLGAHELLRPQRDRRLGVGHRRGGPRGRVQLRGAHRVPLAAHHTLRARRRAAAHSSRVRPLSTPSLLLSPLLFLVAPVAVFYIATSFSSCDHQLRARCTATVARHSRASFLSSVCTVGHCTVYTQSPVSRISNINLQYILVRYSFDTRPYKYDHHRNEREPLSIWCAVRAAAVVRRGIDHQLPQRVAVAFAPLG